MASKYNQLISLTSGGQSGQHAKNDCMEVPTALSRCIRSDVIKIKKGCTALVKNVFGCNNGLQAIYYYATSFRSYLYNCALYFVDHWVVDTFRCYPFITF